MLITNFNRVQILTLLPKGGTVVEVGTYAGGFAVKLLRVLEPTELHLIDPWARDEDDEYIGAYGGQREGMHSAYDQVQRVFHDDIETGRVTLHRKYSTEAVTAFPDHHFDLVYIDAMHSYEHVLEDLLAYKDKVKPDGFIMGHDFSNTHMGRIKKFGVVRAVREFTGMTDFALTLITNEGAPSYLLARSDNHSTLPEFHSALLDHKGSSLIDIDDSLLDTYEQVLVTHADGRKGQMMTLGRFGREADAPSTMGVAKETADARRPDQPDDGEPPANPVVDVANGSGPGPPAGSFSGADLYLDLMKKCLTRTLVGNDLRFKATTREFIPSTPVLRTEGRDWPAEAETMIGLDRLDNIHRLVADVLRWRVPGDLVEAGVWRGGATIFMRALLKAYGDTKRTVWVADSFAGLPEPDPEHYPADANSKLYQRDYLAIPVEDVKANFSRYNLLDDQVRFVVGWFQDALPVAPIERLAILRIDGDMYGSTIVALRSLYPKLSTGGYVIIDDYGAVRACRQAVDDFRTEHGITEPLEQVDWTGVYWQRRPRA